MRRCVHELGFPGIYLPPQVIGATPAHNKNLADEHFYPIYEEAARLDVPLAIHAFVEQYVRGHEHNWPRPGSLLSSDVIGFPMHGMQQLACLILGGVCDAFPNVKFGIFEAGLGWVPMFIDRLHERQEKFSDFVRMAAPHLKLGADEYIQRQIWFGFEPEDAFIPDFIRWTGAPNRLLLSADYPHLDYETGQLDEFVNRTDLSHEHMRLALKDNSYDYFRWEGTAVGAPGRS